MLCISTSPPDLAGQLARQLVEEALAACVNVLPGARSVYRWKGEIEEEAESLLLLKTAENRVDALESRLRQLHPHDCPEFIVLTVDGGSEEYLTWVLENSRSREEPRG